MIHRFPIHLPPYRKPAVIVIFAILAASNGWGAPSFELDTKELERQKPAVPKHRVVPSAKLKKNKATSPTASADEEGYEGKLVRYTVKSGDHIFRILIREFGLSNDEAERLIPTVARINKIGDIRKLSIGQVLLVPAPAPGGAEKVTRTRRPPMKEAAPAVPPVEPVTASAGQKTLKKPATSPVEQNNFEAASPPAMPATTTSEPPFQEAKQAQEPASPPTQSSPSTRDDSPVLPVKNIQIMALSPEETVDALLKALGVEPHKKRIVEFTGDSAAVSSFSIKVDRYIEEYGARIIINCSAKDQFNYTLLRLLENEGYRVVMADGHGFREIAGSILAHLGRPHEYAVRQVRGKDVSGYLVDDGKEDAQIFISESSAQ